MGFNLDYTIHLTAEGADKYATAREVPARASVFGDLDEAKRGAEALIAHAGGTTGKIFETSATSTTFETGRHVSTFVSGEGWTDV